MTDHSTFSDMDRGAVRAAALTRPTPLLVPTLGLLAGIALDFYASVPSIWHYVLFAGAAVQLMVGHRAPGPRRAALFLAGLACGLALHEAAYRRTEPNHIASLVPDRATLVRVRGTVAATPRWTRPAQGAFYTWSSGRYSTRLLLDCQALEVAGEWRFVCGLLPVRINGLMMQLGPGDYLQVFGRLRPIQPAANPGQKDWRLFHWRQGIYARLACSHPEAVRVIEPAAGTGWVDSLRSTARGLLLPEMHALDDEPSTLVESVVLGQRSRVSPALNQAFARTGTSHYLSASGLHVGMLAGFVWMVSAAFGIRRRARALLILVVVVLYAVVAEPRAPILRAATITVLFCLSVFLHRAVHKLNWIAVAAFVILVFRPCDLFSAGFQLSFLVVLGIIYLTPHLVAVLHHLWPERLRPLRRLVVPEQPPTEWRRWGGALGGGLVYAFAVAFAAWCTGLLVVAWHFQQVAPWGWLNSLLLMPLAFGVMICGFVRVLVGLVWPLAGAWMGPVLDSLTQAMAGAVHWLAHWPGSSMVVSRPSLWLLLLVYGAMVYLIWLGRFGAELPLGRLRVWRLSVALLVGLALVTLLWPLPAAPGGLTVDVLAVGAGSATIIRWPDNTTLLYDAGSLNFADAGRSVVVPALAHYRVDAIAAAIVSHLNTDHYNGLPAVLTAVPTARVLLSTYARKHSPPRSSAGRLLDILRHEHVPVQSLVAGDQLRLSDGVTCEVLWPPDASAGPELPINDSSLVLRLEHAGRSVLLCGDIEGFAQRQLMHHPSLASDLLVLPHHGKVITTTGDFLSAVSPSVVIRSSGQASGPTPGPLAALLAGLDYYNTADHGAIRIRLDGGELQVVPLMGSAGLARRCGVVE